MSRKSKPQEDEEEDLSQREYNMEKAQEMLQARDAAKTGRDASKSLLETMPVGSVCRIGDKTVTVVETSKPVKADDVWRAALEQEFGEITDEKWEEIAAIRKAKRDQLRLDASGDTVKRLKVCKAGSKRKSDAISSSSSSKKKGTSSPASSSGKSTTKKTTTTKTDKADKKSSKKKTSSSSDKKKKDRDGDDKENDSDNDQQQSAKKRQKTSTDQRGVKSSTSKKSSSSQKPSGQKPKREEDVKESAEETTPQTAPDATGTDALPQAERATDVPLAAAPVEPSASGEGAATTAAADDVAVKPSSAGGDPELKQHIAQVDAERKLVEGSAPVETVA